MVRKEVVKKRGCSWGGKRQEAWRVMVEERQGGHEAWKWSVATVRNKPIRASWNVLSVGTRRWKLSVLWNLEKMNCLVRQFPWCHPFYLSHAFPWCLWIMFLVVFLNSNKAEGGSISLSLPWPQFQPAVQQTGQWPQECQGERMDGSCKSSTAASKTKTHKSGSV